ncbi:hypothetical protein M419DRAFT_8510 [Trichoderma reesei RUT C-30]|uniref:WD40 repeat-like protein n=1 Tax=Hypocrea jecorina (strain ATCC 56765 / BCRC 32924 / NRRL 11460 / Rut C-30) TaxID=1344414 RepID=A0A024S9W7_HYPJR|nr:hypothetical protein M419DRAFT_8510 [Trichoderma reesei RUT C-30]
MSDTPREIPGFYWDPEKKRYFKVEKSQTAPPTAQWSSSSVKRREHESQVAEQAAKRQQLTKNHVKRSVLTRDAVASGLLARETEIDRTAEAGRGKRENGDVLAAAWAREVTAKGKISFGMSWELSGHPHMSCFYIVGKESGSKSAIAYSALDSQFMVGTYIEVGRKDENLAMTQPPWREPTEAAVVLSRPQRPAAGSLPTYNIVHCSHTSSIKYHAPSNRMLLTSSEPNVGGTLVLFRPPLDDVSSGRNWSLDIDHMAIPLGKKWCVAHQSTPAPAASNLLCVVGTSDGIMSIHSDETPRWLNPRPPNLGLDARAERPTPRGRFNRPRKTPFEIFSQDFQVDNHNVLFAGGRQPRLWISDLRAPAVEWSSIKHGSSIAHVRSINPYQVIVAGLRDCMSVYDTRFLQTGEQKDAAGRNASSPVLDFSEYRNQARFDIGWDVCPELNLVASAQDDSTVKLFSLSSGGLVRAGTDLEGFRAKNPVKALMFQTLRGERLPNLYMADGAYLKKFGCAPASDGDQE